MFLHWPCFHDIFTNVITINVTAVQQIYILSALKKLFFCSDPMVRKNHKVFDQSFCRLKVFDQSFCHLKVFDQSFHHLDIYSISTKSRSLSATKPGVLCGRIIFAVMFICWAQYAAASPAFPPDAHTICWLPFANACGKIYTITIFS